MNCLLTLWLLMVMYDISCSISTYTTQSLSQTNTHHLCYQDIDFLGLVDGSCSGLVEASLLTAIVGCVEAVEACCIT